MSDTDAVAREVLANVMSVKRTTGPSTTERVIAGVRTGASDNRAVTIKTAIAAIKAALSGQQPADVAGMVEARKLIHESLFHLRCDGRAQAYHMRAMAFLHGPGSSVPDRQSASTPEGERP